MMNLRFKNTEKEKKTVKSSKIIRLLAALVCVVMAFVSCSGDAANITPADDAVIKPLTESVPLLDDTTAADTDATITYDALSELLEIKYKSPAYFKEALKIEGELVTEGELAFVVRTSEIFADNLAKEVYSVYSILDGSVILTLENTYDYTLDVKATDINVSFDDYYGVVLVVEKITNTLLTAEEMEGNFRFDEAELNYKEESFYEFYDMKGNLFATSNLSGWVYCGSVHEDSYATPYYARIGDSRHYFNSAFEYVRTEKENEAGIGAYDFERGNYGYKISYWYDDCELVQVFDMITGKLVAQYDLGDPDTLTVLDDGTIFVQYEKFVDDDGADYDYMGEYFDYKTYEYAYAKYNLETYLIDAISGEKTEIEFNYVVDGIYAATDWNQMYSGYSMSEATIKDTVINFARAQKIVDKKLGDELMVFFDNNLGINYEQKANEFDGKPLLGEDYTLLSNGSVLYDTYEKYSIIVTKDGKELLVPNTAEIRDPFIITNDNIYDLDLNLVAKRDYYDNGESKLYYVGSVADWGVFSIETYSDTDGYTTTYYRISDAYNIETMSDVTAVVETTKDYLIVRNGNDKYVLYNSQYEHVFTSESYIDVFAYGEQYWFSTYSNYEGKDLVFKLN